MGFLQRLFNSKGSVPAQKNTIPKARLGDARFIIRTDRTQGKAYGWILISANERIVAVSGHGYKTKRDATDAAKRLVEIAGRAFVVSE